MKKTFKNTLLTLMVVVPAFTFAMEDKMTMENKMMRASSSPILVNVVCTDAAIDKRENALISGHDAFNTSIKSALEARKVALKASWAKTDRKMRQDTRQAAWSAFRTSAQAAHTTMRNARTVSWTTFRTEMKACNVGFKGENAQVVASPASSL